MTKTLPALRPNMKVRFEKEAEALNQAIKTVGVEILSLHLGDKKPATLRSEMTTSKSDSLNKVGFDTALAAMFLSGDITALSIFLDRLDYLIVPAAENQTHAGREQSALKAMAAAGHFNAWLGEALEDGRINDAEWETGTALLKKLECEAATATRNGQDMLVTGGTAL
jgi:hypothetical protein